MSILCINMGKARPISGLRLASTAPIPSQLQIEFNKVGGVLCQYDVITHVYVKSRYKRWPFRKDTPRIMPTTRRQAAIQEGKIKPDHAEGEKVAKKKAVTTKSSTKQASPKSANSLPQQDEKNPAAGKKRSAKEKQNHTAKKAKLNSDATKEQTDGRKHEYQSGKLYSMNISPKLFSQRSIGTIERGHIYFFYRPRVQVDEVQSIDDIRNFHILLVPRPPDFAQGHDSSSKQNGVKKQDPSDMDNAEMKVLAPGADAVPAPDDVHPKKKNYRLITVGKKKLPNPESKKETGKLTKETFWATVTSVGNDLDSLAKGLGEKTYETKTRGSLFKISITS